MSISQQKKSHKPIYLKKKKTLDSSENYSRLFFNQKNCKDYPKKFNHKNRGFRGAEPPYHKSIFWIRASPECTTKVKYKIDYSLKTKNRTKKIKNPF